MKSLMYDNLIAFQSNVIITERNARKLLAALTILWGNEFCEILF